MAPFVKEGQIIVCVAKGIEEDTLMTISDVTEQEIPCADVAVMCGPSHAEEVGIGLPTTVVAGAKTESTAEKIQDLLIQKSPTAYNKFQITSKWLQYRRKSLSSNVNMHSVQSVTDPAHHFKLFSFTTFIYVLVDLLIQKLQHHRNTFHDLWLITK